MQNDFKTTSQILQEIAEGHHRLSLVQTSHVMVAARILGRLEGIKQEVLDKVKSGDDDSDHLANELISLLGIETGN